MYKHEYFDQLRIAIISAIVLSVLFVVLLIIRAQSILLIFTLYLVFMGIYLMCTFQPVDRGYGLSLMVAGIEAVILSILFLSDIEIPSLNFWPVYLSLIPLLPGLLLILYGFFYVRHIENTCPDIVVGICDWTNSVHASKDMIIYNCVFSYTYNGISYRSGYDGYSGFYITKLDERRYLYIDPNDPMTFYDMLVIKKKLFIERFLGIALVIFSIGWNMYVLLSHIR